ncbi:hypothetical protein [Candidatus Chloroploca asiatica]|uniref:PsbP C-terminal domain-containing protein n=1 Tax=Candidatus Chloroploca asiatica TaxID=1506545 RepID=A0A2H3L4V6_9CHLR|nr:hypothetical protein [Candidatus Chloroploca asiatica]PDV99884.1 hypothetical protein A9Q02_01340 [Candidatus Chloroploca asiatica]
MANFLRRLTLAAALLVMLLLTACTVGQNGAPAPLEEPTATFSEQASLDATAEADPLFVEFGELVPYEHPSGVFSIDVPANWVLIDQSRPDELFMTWTDTTRKGGVIINLFEDETAYNEEELLSILDAFLSNNFSGQPEFEADTPEMQNDGSILLAWAYVATAASGEQFLLLGNSFVEQRGNKISILTTLIPDERFDEYVEVTNVMINSYRINPEASL